MSHGPGENWGILAINARIVLAVVVFVDVNVLGLSWAHCNTYGLGIYGLAYQYRYKWGWLTSEHTLCGFVSKTVTSQFEARAPRLYSLRKGHSVADDELNESDVCRLRIVPCSSDDRGGVEEKVPVEGRECAANLVVNWSSQVSSSERRGT